MKTPSELLDDVLDTLKDLRSETSDLQRTSSQILEALAAFVDNGLVEIINDIDDAREAAEELENDLESANVRIEELEKEDD